MIATRRAWFLAVGLLWVLAGKADAHFLFIRIGPMAEAGRSAEVFFSEQAEAGDPKFVDKIAATSLWAQARPGVFQRLTVHKAEDRLRATVPPGGGLSVVGMCEYGVLARPGQTPFLLRYYPKAVAGRPEEIATFARAEGQGIPFEIMPSFDGDRIRFVALRDGKPIPGLTFTTIDSDLTNVEIKAGSDGAAAWSPSQPGRYSVYVKEVLKTPGKHGRQDYDEIREFATLAFTWPLARQGGDPEAVELFEKAVATRASWREFPGFTAKTTGSLNGRAFAGSVAVSADGQVKVDVEDEAARTWLADQLGSIALHRLPEGDRGPSADRPRPVLWFADDDRNHPLGRLLAFQGGRFASSYRVQDGQIRAVNRHVGKQVMTITVLDDTPIEEGKFLPRSYAVHYWDAATGGLTRVETIHEDWVRVGKLDLPSRHVVTESSGEGLSAKSFQLTGHQLGAP